MNTAVPLPSPLSLISQVLRLQEEPFALLQSSPQGLRTALIIVLLAGLSEALAQSVVLFANRVKPHRFAGSLALSAGFYTAGFALFAFSVWLFAGYLFDRQQAFRDVLKAIGLGYAPYLFSFFILTPYWGNGIAVALSLWSLLAILVAIRVTLELSLWQALLCSALGWLLLQVLRRTLGRPVIWSARWLRSRIAGVPLVTDHKGLNELLKDSPWDKN